MNRATWLLLLYALPTPRNAERVNLWRKLKKFGAVQLKTSGYVLPDGPPHRERCQLLAKQIQDAGGQATLVRMAEIDGVSNQEIVDMFNEARAADYREVAQACREFLSGPRNRKAADRTSEMAKLTRRFGEIREIDYFNSPAALDAQTLLRRVERALGVRPEEGTARRLDPKEFAGKVWLTRPRPGIDRAGSAWLIRKFIDAKARFIFDLEPARHPAAIPFDMAGVELSHHGEDCTFETLVKRFGVADKAVRKMAEMVHDADLEDGKFQRCECIGIQCVLTGWERAGMSDAELLAHGQACFEGLYRAVRK